MHHIDVIALACAVDVIVYILNPDCQVHRPDAKGEYKHSDNDPVDGLVSEPKVRERLWSVRADERAVLDGFFGWFFLLGCHGPSKVTNSFSMPEWASNCKPLELRK
jgi:hypothetical protein